jgi:hypothetical protein
MVLRRIALALMPAIGILGSVFIAGEAFDDPVGVEAALLVASWLVPLVVVSIAAWRSPDRTWPRLVAAVASSST